MNGRRPIRSCSPPMPCYFVLCLKAGGWLSGETILPELIRQNRQEYVDALQRAHDTFAAGALDLAPLHAFVSRLLAQQLGMPPVDPMGRTVPRSGRIVCSSLLPRRALATGSLFSPSKSSMFWSKPITKRIQTMGSTVSVGTMHSALRTVGPNYPAGEHAAPHSTETAT